MSDSMGIIRDRVETLGVNLSWWADRETSNAPTACRRAATEALTALDATLAELHKVRQQLVAEVARADKTTPAVGRA